MDAEARKRGPRARGAQVESALQQRWALTLSESAVALLIAAGRSVKEIAVQLEVSEQTVRVHLRHIFAKTGVHRQAALVHLLLGNRSGGGSESSSAIPQLTGRQPNPLTRRPK